MYVNQYHCLRLRSRKKIMKGDKNKNRNKKPSLLLLQRVAQHFIARRSSNSIRYEKKQLELVAVFQHDNDVAVSSLLMALPKPVRVYILNYLGETQKELRTLTLVSKQIQEDCKEPGIEWELKPVFELRPLRNKLNGKATMNILKQYQIIGDDTNRKLQRYRHMIVKDVDKFEEAYDILLGVQMDRIESLDISTPLRTSHVCASIVSSLSRLLPNLRAIDVSNTKFPFYLLSFMSTTCPRLEQIISNNNISIFSGVCLNGNEMSSVDNLNTIIMDNSSFDCQIPGNNKMTHMSDLDNHPDMFLFYKCCKTLERLSIRNAKYYSTTSNQHTTFPQEALIKFVRNAPSTLKWFGSDLTQENKKMLQEERPGIVFSN